MMGVFSVNIAVIQARMSSSRLPGKVLKSIGETTILDSVVERLRRSSSVEKIVVATTTLPIDDSIYFHCKNRSIDVTRGPEKDVLLRYALAVGENFEGNVLRVTADCPLVDPELVDLAYKKFIKLNLDHIGIATGAGVANLKSNRYPDGLDAEWIKYDALLKANREATDLLDREHVTSYIWRNPSKFELGQLEPSQDYSDVKLTVDTAEDLANVSDLVKLLGVDYLKADFTLVVDKYRKGITSGQLRLPLVNPTYDVFYEHDE